MIFNPKSNVVLLSERLIQFLVWSNGIFRCGQIARNNYKIIQNSAQPVSTQRCMRVCAYRHKAEVSAYACAYACVVSSLCPVYFSLPATLRLPPTTLAILSQPTYTGRKSVDQWSRVAGTVVEQVAHIAAVMNATSVHSLQRTTPNPLSWPGLTPCVSSQSPGRLCQPHLCGWGSRQWPVD